MRLLKRRFFKDASIQDRANGCKENIRWRLITYMWNFETRKNNRLKMLIAQLSQQYPEVRFLEIKNDTDMQAAYTMMLANMRNT